MPFFCGFHFNCGDSVSGDAIVEQSQKWNGKADSYVAMREAARAKERKAA